MSQLDLLAELRATRPAAPDALRARVRTIAAAPPATRRRLPALSPRLAFGTLLAAAAALAIVVGVTQRGPGTERAATNGSSGTATLRAAGAPQTKEAVPGATLDHALTAPPSGTRLQDYDATLSLRVRDATALSDATKRALRIARSLGGYATAVDVGVDGREGDARIRVRVPVAKVETALQRLAELGTITGESLQIRDVQAGVNAVDRTVARLQRQLRALRAGEQTQAARQRIAELTRRVEQLQRARATTVRQARLATIALQLTTREPAVPPRATHEGPLHGVVVALRWLGIGAVYALAVGGPVVLLGLALWLGFRALRRRAERRLLERR